MVREHHFLQRQFLADLVSLAMVGVLTERSVPVCSCHYHDPPPRKKRRRKKEEEKTHQTATQSGQVADHTKMVTQCTAV